jgi:uncharacterized protein YukE
MSTIHMETEEVRQTSKTLGNDASELDSISSQLKSAASALSRAVRGVEGGGRYSQGLTNWQSRFETQTVQISDLAMRVSREVDEWETVDSNGFPQESSDDGFEIADDIWNVAKNFFLNNIGKVTYESFKSIGRWINQDIVHNLRGGFVGKMDNLGHWLRSDFGGKIALPFIGDAIFGLWEGEDPAKALLSAGIQTGIEYGLRLIPGVGTVLLVSDIAQLVGHAASGVLAATGNVEAAEGLNNVLDAIDLSGYIEKISDGIADRILNPSLIAQDIQNAQQACTTFGCEFNNPGL